jgi:hypothetical protein
VVHQLVQLFGVCLVVENGQIDLVGLGFSIHYFMGRLEVRNHHRLIAERHRERLWVTAVHRALEAVGCHLVVERLEADCVFAGKLRQGAKLQLVFGLEGVLDNRSV